VSDQVSVDVDDLRALVGEDVRSEADFCSCPECIAYLEAAKRVIAKLADAEAPA
jgi:hypothetical protein